MAYDYDSYKGEVRNEPVADKVTRKIFALFATILFFMVVMALVDTFRPEVKVEEPTGPTMDMLAQTYTSEAGNPIRAYVIIDPETGYHYIVTDRGGICRREGIEWEQNGRRE